MATTPREFALRLTRARGPWATPGTLLVQERARTINRLQTVLEDANIKLASVVTDIRGVSARAMREALMAGEQDVSVLAALARGRMRSKRQERAEALQGHVLPHHCFLLTEHLRPIDYLDEAIERVSATIAAHLARLSLRVDPI